MRASRVRAGRWAVSRAGARSYEVTQVSKADHGNDSSHRPDGNPTSWPAGKSPKGDAGHVQHAGRDDKPHRIGDGIRSDRKLGAMRMAMKDGEGSDQDRCDP